MAHKMKLTFGLILFWTMGYCQTFPDTLTENHRLITGTNLYLVPPQSFSPSSKFKGFQNPNDQTSMIMIIEMPGPFSEITKGFNAKMFKSRGMDLISKKEIKISNYDGFFIALNQSAANVEFSKFLLVFGNESSSTMINGIFPKDSLELGLRIKESILSTYINSNLVANPRDALDYTLDENAGNLKFKAVIGNGILFNRDLKTPTQSPDKASLLTDKSFVNTEIKDQKMFCALRIKKYPDNLSLIVDKGINPIEIDGLSGYELYAKNNDRKNEEVYQVILFSDLGGYYIFAGTYLEGSQETLDDIKNVILTFKRKK